MRISDWSSDVCSSDLRDYQPKVDHDVLNGRLAHDFETQYDHDFPARNFGISLWAAIDYGLFHEAKSGVVAGNEGWLYTDEAFKIGSASDCTPVTNAHLV